MERKRSYEEKRAETIRELKHLQKRLLDPWCTVEQINRAYNIKKQYKEL